MLQISGINHLGLDRFKWKSLRSEFDRLLTEISASEVKKQSELLGEDADWDRFVLVEKALELLGSFDAAFELAVYVYNDYRKYRSFENLGLLNRQIQTLIESGSLSKDSESTKAKKAISHITTAWKLFNESAPGSYIEKIPEYFYPVDFQ